MVRIKIILHRRKGPKRDPPSSTSIRLTRLRSRLDGAPPLMSGLNGRNKAVEPVPPEPANIPAAIVARRLRRQSARQTPFPDEARQWWTEGERLPRKKLRIRLHGTTLAPGGNPGNLSPTRMVQKRRLWRLREKKAADDAKAKVATSSQTPSPKAGEPGPAAPQTV